jgi:hypothetical protein
LRQEVVVSDPSSEALSEAISAILDTLREGYPKGLSREGVAKIVEVDFKIPREEYDIIEETLIEKQWIEEKDGKLYYYHSHKMS